MHSQRSKRRGEPVERTRNARAWSGVYAACLRVQFSADLQTRRLDRAGADEPTTACAGFVCSASADVQQPPRPWRRRLRLKSDSSCRGVPRPLRLPNPSGGATTGHMDFCRFSRAGPSDSPSAGRSSKDGISLRRKRRCPVPVARSTPDEDQANHGSRKAAMYGVRPSQQRAPWPRRMHGAAMCLPRLPTAETALNSSELTRRTWAADWWTDRLHLNGPWCLVSVLGPSDILVMKSP